MRSIRVCANKGSELAAAKLPVVTASNGSIVRVDDVHRLSVGYKREF